MKKVKQVGTKREEISKVKGVWIFTIEAWGYMQITVGKTKADAYNSMKENWINEYISVHNTSKELATEGWELRHGHEEPSKIIYGEVIAL